MKTSIILIDKRGNVKEQKILAMEESELYKKAGFKHPDNFLLRHTWIDVGYEKICVYAKTEGTNGSMNKYTFPPPLDESSFYGTVIIIIKKDDEFKSITIDEWNDLYKVLTIKKPNDVIISKPLDDFTETMLEYESELSEEEYI